MRTSILALLFSLVACSTANKTLSPTSGAEPEHQCTAFGHGPYNMNRDQCMDLAKHQARTNCGLSGQIAKVEYMGKEWDGRIMIDFKGSCTAEPGKANEDCKVKSCN